MPVPDHVGSVLHMSSIDKSKSSVPIPGHVTYKLVTEEHEGWESRFVLQVHATTSSTNANTITTRHLELYFDAQNVVTMENLDPVMTKKLVPEDLADEKLQFWALTPKDGRKLRTAIEGGSKFRPHN